MLIVESNLAAARVDVKCHVTLPDAEENQTYRLVIGSLRSWSKPQFQPCIRPGDVEGLSWWRFKLGWIARSWICRIEGEVLSRRDEELSGILSASAALHSSDNAGRTKARCSLTRNALALSTWLRELGQLSDELDFRIRNSGNSVWRYYYLGCPYQRSFRR